MQKKYIKTKPMLLSLGYFYLRSGIRKLYQKK